MPWARVQKLHGAQGLLLPSALEDAAAIEPHVESRTAALGGRAAIAPSKQIALAAASVMRLHHQYQWLQQP
jgi:hypothetical protein